MYNDDDIAICGLQNEQGVISKLKMKTLSIMRKQTRNVID